MNLQFAYHSQLEVDHRDSMIRIDPRNEKKLMLALFETDSARTKLFNVVTTCPLTNTAWITQSMDTNVSGWIILCIFPDDKQAHAAMTGLSNLLEVMETPDVKIEVSLKSLLKIGRVADSIDADKAVAPRGDVAGDVDDATRKALKVFDSEISKIKLANGLDPKPKKTKPKKTKSEKAAAKTTEQEQSAGEVTEVFAKPSPSQHLPAAPPQTSTTTSNSTNTSKSIAPPVQKAVEPSTQAFDQTPAQSAVQSGAQTSIQNSVQPSAQFPVQPAALATTESSTATTAQSVPTSGSSSAMNASALSQMSYADIVTLQTRYLGETETGIPVHGCILCGQRDHLWEICPGRKCEHCGDTDKHVSRACLKIKKCSKCREKGHTVDDCPSKLKRTAEDGFLCERCGDDTHFEEDCSYIFRHIIPEKMSVKKAPFLSIFCYNCASKGLLRAINIRQSKAKISQIIGAATAINHVRHANHTSTSSPTRRLPSTSMRPHLQPIF
jgi:hypothetical protein